MLASPAQVLQRAFFIGIRACCHHRIRDNGYGVRHIAVVHYRLLDVPFSHCPNMLVAIGRHYVQHFQLMLQYDGIGLIINEFQRRTAAPNIVPVRCPVAIEPMPVLIEDRFSQRIEDSSPLVCLVVPVP